MNKRPAVAATARSAVFRGPQARTPPARGDSFYRPADLSRERCNTAASKVFLRAKKLWVNPPKAERAKPSLSSDYNLLFKNKIGESSLDIHRTLYLQCLNSALRRFRLLRPRLTSQPASLRLATSVAIGTGRDLPGYHTCASSPIRRIYASTVSVEVSG